MWRDEFDATSIDVLYILELLTEDFQITKQQAFNMHNIGVAV